MTWELQNEVVTTNFCTQEKRSVMLRKFRLLKEMKQQLGLYATIECVCARIRGIFKFIPYVASTNSLLPWLASVLLGHDALTDHIPWVTFEAQKWLTSYLKADMSLFEYGSGGSTIFFSKKVKALISVEHNRYWYHRVSIELAKEHITNCKLFLKEPEQGTFDKTDYSDPESYLSAAPKYKDMNFRRYATSIQEFPDESFDLVFIDGRARPSCILNAMVKVRPGGNLMLDNSDRKRYYRGKNLLKKWCAKKFYGVGSYRDNFWETTIWRKPAT